MSNDVIKPPIDDGSGYCIRRRDLRFLHLTDRCVGNWRVKASPLGLSMRQYRDLLDGLHRALWLDGIEPATCDIRLKGSSAEFYSGHHKPMPRTRNDIIDLFRTERSKFPREREIERIMERLLEMWITDGAFPGRRPFDSLFELGVAREPSDIDLQLSGDELVRRCEDLLTSRGQDPTAARLRHTTYNFMRKDLVDYEFEHLYRFSLRQFDALGRHVNIAVFPSCGPPDTTAVVGPLSAHFRRSDWRVETSPPKASGR
ncbi:MAG TPA: hypothetical protein VFF79_01380 [Conexibacter sp.]|jgi:hypothetical protein|nr:hypothetical protein [Conexibacter sp.]